LTISHLYVFSTFIFTCSQASHGHRREANKPSGSSDGANNYDDEEQHARGYATATPPLLRPCPPSLGRHVTCLAFDARIWSWSERPFERRLCFDTICPNWNNLVGFSL
jgi:hypothetical protein